MSNNDVKRLEIHTRLTEVLGTNVADHLMDYLPVVGWQDIARGSDLRALSEKMDGKFAAIDGKFVAVDARIGAVEVRISDLASRIDSLGRTMWAVAGFNWTLTIALIAIVLGSR
jgi:hypothetical protein